MIKKIIYFIPSFLVMSVIFYLSSLNSTGIGGPPTFQFIIHKALHLFVYSFLSITFLFGFTKSNSKHSLRYSIILSYLYGVSDELHQSFVPGRGAKFTDTLFDLLGALIGIYIVKKLKLFKTAK